MRRKPNNYAAAIRVVASPANGKYLTRRKVVAFAKGAPARIMAGVVVMA
ncbi:MAG: hypothetical protein AAF720_09150 [Pseudomonadota bacterium]